MTDFPSDDLGSLRAAWQSASSTPPALDAETFRALQRDARSMNRTLVWRDAREIVVALGLALYFAFQLGRPAADVPWGGAQLVVSCALMLWIVAVLLGVRMRYGRPLPGSTVREALQAERDWLAAQAALLHWAWLWYVLPVWASVTLWTEAGWTVQAVVTLGCAGIAWINRRSARRDLAPLREQTEALLRGLA